MRKLRKDALGSRLTENQRELLDKWLFAENIGYQNAIARAQTEWGIPLTLGALCRYRQRCAKEREFGDMISLALAGKAGDGSTLTPEMVRVAALRLVGEAAFKVVKDRPHNLAGLACLARALFKGRDTELRERQLQLMERKLESQKRAEVAR